MGLYLNHTYLSMFTSMFPYLSSTSRAIQRGRPAAGGLHHSKADAERGQSGPVPQEEVGRLMPTFPRCEAYGAGSYLHHWVIGLRGFYVGKYDPAPCFASGFGLFVDGSYVDPLIWHTDGSVMGEYGHRHFFMRDDVRESVRKE